MQLSRRLKAVAESVTVGNRVADVGCDHAYISIYLIENGIAPQVIAMDVNKGPLERAGQNIARRGYDTRIHTRLSDGLQGMEPGEADTILMAGMGGALMIRLLEEGLESVRKCRELVLQPQSEIVLVRKYIHQTGFYIASEQMLKEDGKFYTVIRAVPGTGERYERELFYRYGKLLLERHEPVLEEYLIRERRLQLQVMAVLKQNPTENAARRLQEVRQELESIEEALTYYKK